MRNRSNCNSNWAENEVVKPNEFRKPLFAMSYAINDCKELIRSLMASPVAKPPATVQREIWMEDVGQPRLIELQRISREQYESDCVRYEARVKKIERHNEEVEVINDGKIKAHKRVIARWKEERDRVATQLNCSKKRSASDRASIRVVRREKLVASIDGQVPLFVKILRQTHSIAEEPMPDLLAFAPFVLGLQVGLQAIGCLGGYFTLLYALGTLFGALLPIGYLNWPEIIQTRVDELKNNYPNDFPALDVVRFCKIEGADIGERNIIATPVYYPNEDRDRVWRIGRYWEKRPLSGSQSCRGGVNFGALVAISAIIPIVSAIWIYYFCRSEQRVISPTDDQLEVEARRIINRRKGELLAEFDNEAATDAAIENDYEVQVAKLPAEPKKPELERKEELPKSPVLGVVDMPVAPSFTDACGIEPNSLTLRGAEVHSSVRLSFMARSAVYAKRLIRPFFPFGGLPLAITDGQPLFAMCIGGTGSGKTTVIRRLCSYLMPLPAAQRQRIRDWSVDGEKRRPNEHREWSRSHTFQAIVYNAKGENIPFLAALGFSPGEDMYILDPSDSRCSAWDLAADLNDRESIVKFAELLVPISKGSKSESNADFWDAQARSLIEAVIVSLRNASIAAGKPAAWTLQDIINAFETPESLSGVLKYHDKPHKIASQHLNLASAQRSSVFMSATTHLAKFEHVASRWAEATRRGNVISLRGWLKNGVGTVLVLPNTMENVPVYTPLNQSIFRALTNLILTSEYSLYTDDKIGVRSVRRLVVIDEIGQAGRLPDLERLLSEGRTFGVNFVGGLHQLSQLRETYGDNNSETILGLCTHLSFLKTGDTTTAKFASERVGQRLQAYAKKTFTAGFTSGESFTAQYSETSGDSEGLSISVANGSSATLTDGEATSKTRSYNTGSNGKYSQSTSTNDQSSASRAQGVSKQITLGASSQQSHSDTQSMSHSVSTQTSTGTSRTTELREEAAILPAEFMSFVDPATSGEIESINITPQLPVYRDRSTIAQLLPELDDASALQRVPAAVRWESDDEVGTPRSWDANDVNRLGLGRNCLPPIEKKSKDGPLAGDMPDSHEEEDEDDNQGPLAADFDI